MVWKTRQCSSSSPSFLPMTFRKNQVPIESPPLGECLWHPGPGQAHPLLFVLITNSVLHIRIFCKDLVQGPNKIGYAFEPRARQLSSAVPIVLRRRVLQLLLRRYPEHPPHSHKPAGRSHKHTHPPRPEAVSSWYSGTCINWLFI